MDEDFPTVGEIAQDETDGKAAFIAERPVSQSTSGFYANSPPRFVRRRVSINA
jgi:hypothetical protein